MLCKTYAAIAAAAVIGLSGCETQGGWMGASGEKKYDVELDKQRLVAVLNNDDYYEYHKDGKIYVLADARDVKNFLATDEFALRVTNIGGGPKGETLIFAIAKPESAKKEGFGAVEMYHGRRKGAEKGFYGEVMKKNTYYVFSDWNSLDAYRRNGSFKVAASGKAKDGKPVKFATSDPALKDRFNSLRG